MLRLPVRSRTEAGRPVSCRRKGDAELSEDGAQVGVHASWAHEQVRGRQLSPRPRLGGCGSEFVVADENSEELVKQTHPAHSGADDQLSVLSAGNAWASDLVVGVAGAVLILDVKPEAGRGGLRPSRIATGEADLPARPG
ncbi:hypothetical protein ACWER9_23405 [Micromonospora sp. NPDC003944]